MSVELAIDESIYADPYRPQHFMADEAPCDTCEYATRCGAECLACCAYAAYANGRRWAHREPSADWYGARRARR